MSLNMYLGEVHTQTQSMNAVCTATIQGMEQAIQSIDAFAIDTVLQGQTYSSAKAFFAQTFRPLAQGIIYLCEELIRQNDAFPSQFQSQVASTDVIEHEILEQIREIDRMKASMEAISQALPIPGMDAMTNLFIAMRRKLQEKLDHLYQFNQTSSNNYNTAIQLAAIIATGLAEVQSGKGFSPASGTFSTQGLNMKWAASIQAIAEDRNRQADNSIEDGEMCGRIEKKSPFRKAWDDKIDDVVTMFETVKKMWNGTVIGTGKAVEDEIKSMETLSNMDIGTFINVTYAILHLDETTKNMWHAFSSTVKRDIIDGDAESITQWTTYGLTQIGIGLILDKGLGRAGLVTKGAGGASTLAKGVTLVKELKQASEILQSFKKDVSYAFSGGNGIRSRFNMSDFRQSHEKLSSYQLARGESSSGGGNHVGENHTPSLSNREIISNLQHTEKFRGNVPKHILEGEINWRGDAMGYHSEVLENTPGKIISGTKEVVNDQGVYKARVEVNGIPKSGNRGFSTFFPKDWSPQKIVDNINEAYNNRTYEFGNTYSGIGSDGIRISMYIDGNGKIISAFPSE
ncbi:cytoplasmic protein [Bacillus wiedmannii]|uniref:LXG domain of WXG superfamily protein n=2 Tax=Bacillus cereus group TaxID=86661 RepID=A0A1G6PUF4_9BACI|nr:EndoU domain-containing protein [Bacillus wiedmannii]KMP28360.1 cytoplasmic protein [Bacillus wiedmannii]MED2839386.1 EndoU domain-containing protein [Bacillus wiedmannii]OAK18805.1 cytoplasmic protein [Bacillus wiedmannii]PHB73005.1 cytoplasmic protein [Bacillus wiedmannii]SDC83611.1 LXG domain of WXG superfamily protein [Bacillus wiedmannii]